MMARITYPTHDRPVTAAELDDMMDDGDTSRHVLDQDDIFELRACSDCGVMLPLDKPARLVVYRDDTVPVCSTCYDLNHSADHD